MLPRSHRLTNSDDILHTIRTGKTRSTPYFRLKYSRQHSVASYPELDSGSPSDQSLLSDNTQSCSAKTRFAFICSKKQLKRAVDRNRVQRRLRAQVTPLISLLKPGYHIVFLIQAAALDATASELQTAVRSQLKDIVLPENNQ